MVTQLFAGDSLREWLHGPLLRSAQVRISGLPDDTLLGMSHEELSALVTQEFWIEPIAIDHDRISRIGEHPEVKAGNRIVVVRFAIPYKGNKKILTMHPPVYPCSGVKVDALDDDHVEIIVETAPTSSAALEEKVRGVVADIERYLSYSNNAAEQYNRALTEVISGKLATVREEVVQAQKMIEGLPFRLYRDEKAARVVMPLQRKVVRPERRPGGSSFKPNHVLEEADYEATLEVLHDMRTVIERNPSTFAKLAIQEKEDGIDKVEERYRDLFLVVLNTHFRGEVGSEVFNNDGKTDILIRVEDRNIFIGECKFWRGPASINKAVSQILKYHSWRDTKAGLLLFVENRDFQQVVDKAVARLLAYPHVRPGKHHDPAHATTRFDVVMRSHQDPDHHIHVALLPFAIPKQRPTAPSAAGKPKTRRRTNAAQIPTPTSAA